MSQLTKAAFEALYGTSGTTFADNTTRDISEGDLRTFGQDVADSLFITTGAILRTNKQLTGGSSMQNIGSSPQTILSAPGTGYWLNILTVSIAYDYGAAVYNFGSSDHIVAKFSGATDGDWRMPYSVMNGGADFQRIFGRYDIATTNFGSTSAPANTAFVLTTAAGGNATTGDGDVQVIVTYTVEPVNS